MLLDALYYTDPRKGAIKFLNRILIGAKNTRRKEGRDSPDQPVGPDGAVVAVAPCEILFMNVIIARMGVVTYLTLLTAFGAGLASWLLKGVEDPVSTLFPLHLYLGLFAVFLTLGVHCLVFIYFLGTGRWVKEVALAYGLPDAPLPKQTRELKRSTFPVALTAMLVAIATAAAGAAVQTQRWHWSFHFSLAVVTLLVNAWAFWVECRNTYANAGIIDEVMREVDRIRAERGLPTNAEALEQEQAQMGGR